MSTREQNQLLHDYLNKVLPDLSLDPETYIPYITGCLDSFQENELDEELDEIMSLLQASSESHSDDEQVWPELKREILSKYKDYKDALLRKNKESEEERRILEEKKRKEDLEEAQREKERRKLAEEENARRKEMDPTKKSLLEQYAYDSSEIYDDDGNLIEENVGKNKEEEEAVTISNRAMAEKMNKERAQQIRGAHNTYKKEEREKTKQAKMDKMKQKEERRKRAQKGERKR
jgi:hypothetical protein